MPPKSMLAATTMAPKLHGAQLATPRNYGMTKPFHALSRSPQTVRMLEKMIENIAETMKKNHRKNLQKMKMFGPKK